MSVFYINLVWGGNNMIEILKLLEANSKLTAGQIAAMLDMEEQEVEKSIAAYEADGTILKYTALVDYDKIEEEVVKALIEVKISPQRGEGFERIAERIYQYDEVESLYLMSGAFDLAVTISSTSMKSVAEFVYAHLATIEGVTGTSTHFILKKYKENNCVFAEQPEQEERLYFV